LKCAGLYGACTLWFNLLCFALKISFKNENPVFNLNSVDPEDIGDVLLKIETSFNIRFEKEDLHDVKTFGQLCDVVQKKVKQKNGEGCTTQHAFYMLRHAINNTIGADKDLIKPQTKLSNIFPSDTRLQVIAEIEKELGFKMNLLKPKGAIVFAFSMLLGASLFSIYFLPIAGGAGTLLAIIGLILAGKFGKEMPVKTLGDLAEKIAREHYLNCRRNAAAVNRAEITDKVKELFVHELALEPQVVNGNSRF